jgi:hypothetical protein
MHFRLEMIRLHAPAVQKKYWDRRAADSRDVCAAEELRSLERQAVSLHRYELLTVMYCELPNSSVRMRAEDAEAKCRLNERLDQLPDPR